MSALAGMRIGVVTPRLEQVGGTEVYVQRLMGIQRVLGAQVSAFTAEDTEMGESLHPCRRPSARAVADSSDRIVASCDLVEFHGCAPLPLIRALNGRIPVVLYAHTAELTCPAGGRVLPASGGVCARSPGAGCLVVDARQRCLSLPDGGRFRLLQRVRATLRGSLSRAAMRVSRAMVFNSHALRDLFHATVGNPRRDFVLPPPLPETEPPQGARKPNRLLFCGRLVGFKGVLDAIQVCAELPGTELVIAGEGPEEVSARRLVGELGMVERVTFRGWLDARAVAAEMAQAGCLIMPGRSFEAWGMTGPEAVAQGCAVAAWEVGGVAEWCREPWGRLASLGSRGALARQVAAILEAAPSRDARLAWRQAALEKWGPQVFAAGYQRVIQQVTSEVRS